MIIIMFGYYVYLVDEIGFRSSQTTEDYKSKPLETEV